MSQPRSDPSSMPGAGTTPGINSDSLATATTSADITSEYRLIKRGNVRNFNVMRFGLKMPNLEKPGCKVVMKREERQEVNAEETKDTAPVKGLGSVYKDDKKWGKTKRRFVRRKEGEMPIQLDLDSNISYTGTREGGQTANYAVLMMNDNGECDVIPVHSWYRFQQNVNYRTLSLEEAEEMMKKYMAVGERWVMKHKKTEDTDETGAPNRQQPWSAQERNKDADDLSEDEAKELRRKKMSAGIRDVEKEAWEFEETFSDDDDTTVPKEIFEEEESAVVTLDDTGESGEEEDQGQDDDTLTAEGKALKRLLKDKGKEQDDDEQQIEEDADESGDEGMVEAKVEHGTGVKRHGEFERASVKKVKHGGRKTGDGAGPGKGGAERVQLTEEYLCRLLANNQFTTKTLLQHMNPILRMGNRAEKEANKERFKSLMMAVAKQERVAANGDTRHYVLKPQYRAKYGL